MSTLTEETHAGEFLVSEANGRRSREAVTIESGQDLKAGAVLGKVIAGSTSASADAANTGDGAIGSIATLAGVKAGDYAINFLDPVTDAGAFEVQDPDGVSIGTGDVGTQFSAGGIQFTISDGASNFEAGDRFTITVSGSGEYKEYDPSNTDGSGTAVSVLYGPVDASSGAKDGVAVVRDAEVDRNQLGWFSSATSSQKDTGVAELQDVGIIAR